MDLGLPPQSGLNRRAQQRLADLIRRSHGGAEHRGDRARRMGQTQSRFLPAHLAGLAAVHFRALVVRFGHLHNRNPAPVDLGDQCHPVSFRDLCRRFRALVDRLSVLQDDRPAVLAPPRYRNALSASADRAAGASAPSTIARCSGSEQPRQTTSAERVNGRISGPLLPCRKTCSATSIWPYRVCQ